MGQYQLFEYLSDDGLRLFARDYNHCPGAPTILCLHGLTRNSADFEPLCAGLAHHYRLIVPDQRGRGLSDNDRHPENYHPLRYNLDMLTLLHALNIDRVHIIGTSMGGIMGMLLAAEHPRLVGSLVLNDIGPEVELAGVRMIAAAVGAPPRYRNWEEAIQRIAQIQMAAFPDFTMADWQTFAHRTCRETDDGVVPDYDPAIGRVFAAAGDTMASALWDTFEQLSALPILVIRGALSSILSRACCERMRAVHPQLRIVEIGNRGHAPLLDEPPARVGIEAFLALHAQ